ncbi:MAG: YcgL domain-containing protein [Xanthomonadales bacterium]|nr:YcgL domain-containing protein [Xanthomonadales bacterium]
MKCSVVRSSLKGFTYIYLLAGHDFEDLPSELKEVFGKPELVMDLELTPERKLAYADITHVMQNLSEQGYHLQMPPKQDATGVLDLPGKPEEA